MSEDKSIIELENDQVAFVLGNEGFELFIPEPKDKEEPVQDAAIFVVALASLIQDEDEEFLAVVDKRIDELHRLAFLLEEEDGGDIGTVLEE